MRLPRRRTGKAMEASHEPVLMEEVMEALALRKDDTVLDATLGGAGHFSRILSALGEGGTLVGIDADREAVERARETYALDRRMERPTAHILVDNFRNLRRILERLEIGNLDAALFDLGWSGYQLSALRGFSFAEADEPLLMTYGTGEEGPTAAAIINSASESELARILREHGEERFAREIAREIVRTRAKARLLTVGDLVAAVLRATPGWYQARRTHAATKTFQALRIATNDELGALREGLTAALEALAPGGRLAVITFHSIEDRAVKRFLRDAETAGRGSAAKKPVAPARAEIAKNRRARSAKLRIFIKHPMHDGRSAPASIVPLLSYV